MKQCNFKDQLSGGRKFSFMGHHMGGRIGMLLALTQPYKVRNLGIYVSRQILFKIDIFEEIKIVDLKQRLSFTLGFDDLFDQK